MTARMMFFRLQLLVVCVLAGCQLQPIKDDPVPLQTLLVLPQVYDGAEVIVTGCLLIAFEGDGLYPNCEVMERLVMLQRVRLAFDAAGKMYGAPEVRRKTAEACSGLYVSVEGEFDRLTGMGSVALIKNIQSFSLWEHPDSTKDPARRDRIRVCEGLLKGLPPGLPW